MKLPAGDQADEQPPAAGHVHSQGGADLPGPLQAFIDRTIKASHLCGVLWPAGTTHFNAE